MSGYAYETTRVYHASSNVHVTMAGDGLPRRRVRHSDAEYEVQRVVLTWERGAPDGPWELVTPQLYGYRIKKDGTPGGVAYNETLYRFDTPTLPDWLLEIVDHLAAELPS